MACTICGPTLGANPRCPDHGLTTTPEDDPSPEATGDDLTPHAHYAGEADADAIGLHAREHLCLRCGLEPLCRFAPSGGTLLIVVSRCRAFAADE